MSRFVDCADCSLPEKGWLQTLRNYLRYKAKEGDVISVHDKRQKNLILNTIRTRSPDINVTIVVREHDPEVQLRI